MTIELLNKTMVKRDNKGKFIYTTGAGRYARKEVDGKNEMLSRHIWEQHHGKIPVGMIIHHIDKNKLNNDINNLAMMSYAAHNKLHACDRPIWNKGITAKTNKKWADAVKKANIVKLENRLPKFKEAYELFIKGNRVVEIASIQGVCSRQIYSRIKRYKQLNNIQ